MTKHTYPAGEGSEHGGDEPRQDDGQYACACVDVLVSDVSMPSYRSRSIEPMQRVASVYSVVFVPL